MSNSAPRQSNSTHHRVHYPDGGTAFITSDKLLQVGETWKAAEETWRVVKVSPAPDDPGEHAGGLWDVWVEAVTGE